MPSQRDVKRRIDSVKNIRKITRTMELIATARVLEAMRLGARAVDARGRELSRRQEGVREQLELAHELQSRSTRGCPPHLSQQFSHNFVLELYRLPDVERSVALNLAAIPRNVGDGNRKTRAIIPKSHDLERHLGAKTTWRKGELRLPRS